MSGPAAEMPPDPLLATIIDAVTGPDGPGVGTLSDDQLIGVIAAVRRLESRVAWYALTAAAEFAARYGHEVAGAPVRRRPAGLRTPFGDRDHAGVPVGCASGGFDLHLPQFLAALGAGLIHAVPTCGSSRRRPRSCPPRTPPPLMRRWRRRPGSLTFGKLRSAAHRLVLELDPEAAARRKEAGRRNAYVQPFREPSGNAGMIARELPSDEVLASWQHVEQRALDLRAAGIPGTLEELRVRAYLDLLQERHTRLTVPAPGRLGCPATAGPQGAHRHRTETTTARAAAFWSRGRPGRQRLWRPARRGCRAQPGRAGHHYRAVARADRPVRRPG